MKIKNPKDQTNKELFFQNNRINDSLARSTQRKKKKTENLNQ